MNESNLRSDPSIALPAVVITGATEGIGRALAEEFARDGHALVLVARDHAKLAKTAEELARAHGVEVKVTSQDLSTPEGCAGVEQAVRGFGFYAEYLVNNAGIMSSGFFQDEDPATVRRIVDLNVRAMVDLTMRFLPGDAGAEPRWRAQRLLHGGLHAGALSGDLCRVQGLHPVFLQGACLRDEGHWR